MFDYSAVLDLSCPQPFSLDLVGLNYSVCSLPRYTRYKTYRRICGISTATSFQQMQCLVILPAFYLLELLARLAEIRRNTFTKKAP